MLTTIEIERFRRLKHAAIVLALMIRLDKPCAEQELAEILAMSQETVRTHLRTLSALSLTARAGRYSGWHVLPGGRQLVLPIQEQPALPGNAENPRSLSSGDPIMRANAENPRSTPTQPELQDVNFTPYINGNAENPRSLSSGDPIMRANAENPRSNAENPRSTPIITINTYSINREGREEVIIEPPGNAENPRSTAVIAEMRAHGLSLNRRTAAIAAREEMTPEIVRETAARLQRAGKGGRQWLGLLVRELEQPTQPAGSREQDPRRGWDTCPDCGCSPCRCEVGE